MSLKPDFEMTPHNALESHFLGSARLVLNDQELKLSFKKVLALMAYLALEGSTPRSKLVGLLWSDLDEDSARRNLRRELHRLKTKTPQLEGRCESVGDDLRLAEPFSSDAQTFLNAVAGDDPETALEMYKGVLLEGLALSGASGFDEWLEVKRGFFERLYKKAMLDLAERLEVRGEWRRALELHLKLLEQDELQERQHREIMRLHYLLGEREAALEQFERFKVILNTELKLEPLPETLELARQIRAAQTLMPQAQTRVSSQALLLPRTAPLVGRVEAWAQMEAAWSAGQLIFISGEPGVGKTRLMLEFAATKGAFHQNTGRPGDSLAPYSTAIRTISDLLEAHPRLELPVWVKRELSRLLPTLSSEPPPLIGSLEERLRFFNAFVELVMLVLRDLPILISDDMQFFDAASLELGLYASQRFLGTGGKHLIAAFRRGDLQADTQSMIEQFVASGQAVLIELEPLAENDVLELVRGLSGADGATLFSKRLHHATGGNPFFALETIRNLFDTELLTLDSSGGWITPFDNETSDYAELPIPPSVRDAVLRRVKSLGAPSQRLLEAASLTGDGFSLETLQGATALNEWEGLEGLENAIRARILEPFSEGYKFAHDLIGSSIEENLSNERKKLLHQKLATSLEKTASQPAQIANHLEKAGLKLEAVTWRVKAAEAAEKVYANQEALEQYHKALEDNAMDEVAFKIHEARTKIWLTLNQISELELEILELERLSQRLGTSTAQAIVTLFRCQTCNAQSSYQEARQLATTILSLTDLPADLSIQAQYECAFALLRLGQLSESEQVAQVALNSNHEPNPAMQAQLHGLLKETSLQQGHLEQALLHTRFVKTLNEQIGNTKNQIVVLTNLASIHWRLGESSEVEALLEQALHLARETGAIKHQQHILINLAGALNRLNKTEAAISQLQESLTLPGADRNPHLRSQAYNTLGTIFEEQGQYGKALAAYQNAFQTAEAANLLHEVILCGLNLAELHMNLNDLLGAEPYLQRAATLIEAEHGEFVAWSCCLSAQRLLLQNQPLEALQVLLETQTENPNADDHDLELLYKAQAYLMLDQPAQALSVLETKPQAERYVVWLQATELRALTVLNRLTDEMIAQALERVSVKVQTLETLELRRVLAFALETTGKLEKALEVSQSAQKLVLEMAATLNDFPELQKSFLEKNRDLLTL